MENQQHLPIKNRAKEDQPREKLKDLGKKRLSNAELLAILIRDGVTGASAVDIAQKILKDADNNLTNLSRIEITKLKEYAGIGDAKAITIIAALELGYRMLGEKVDINVATISESKDLFNYIAPQIIDLDHEEFWAIFLNNKHKILGKKAITTGGLTSTPVDIRLIFKYAIEMGSTTIAVAHNHPSGSVMPSKEDKLLTEKISSAGKLLGIKLLDHVILGVRTDNDTLTQSNWYSFAEHGLI